MNGKLRNMTSIYLLKDDKILLLYRQGGRVVNNVWTGSAGGHFEEYELNNAQTCVLREMKEELGIDEENIEGLSLRYITLRRSKGEIRLNYYFFANLKAADELTSNEGICKWFLIDEIFSLKTVSYTHLAATPCLLPLRILWEPPLRNIWCCSASQSLKSF